VQIGGSADASGVSSVVCSQALHDLARTAGDPLGVRRRRLAAEVAATFALLNDFFACLRARRPAADRGLQLRCSRLRAFSTPLRTIGSTPRWLRASR